MTSDDDALDEIVSGKMASDFAEDVDREAEESNVPAPLVLVKKLMERALSPNSPLNPKQPTEEKKDDFISTTRAALERRRSLLKRRTKELETGRPSGEDLSKVILDVMMVPLAQVKEDPTFFNTRLYDDILTSESSANEGHTLESLEISMSEEGLKVPIVVRPGPKETLFLRAGFRRVKCARKLGWKEIPAVVLPSDLTDSDEYWVNILENSTRKSLRTYEMAKAAQLMRDKFGVSAEEFSKKTGYSVSHIKSLLSCIDRLPDELIEQWRLGARLPFEQWYTLSLLEPLNAIRYFRRWTGQAHLDTLKDLGAAARNNRKLAPAAWLDRMQRLYLGLEGSELDLKTRQLCLKVVEFCMGQIGKIPGVYEPQKRKEYERRARLRSELRLPEVPDPGQEREMPPPVDMSEDD